MLCSRCRCPVNRRSFARPPPMSDSSLPSQTPPRPVSRATAPGASPPLRLPTSLLSLGSAAVLSIYAAGYLRTQAAAEQFARDLDAHRRPERSTGPSASVPPEAVTGLVTGVPPVAADATTPSAKSTTPPATVAITKASNAHGATGAASDSALAPSVKPAAATSAAATSAAVSPSVSTAGAPASATATPATPAAVAPAPVAPAPVAAPAAPDAAPAAPPAPAHPAWQDGTYTGWGTSRHGDIEATVTIEHGRITGAAISRCLTRYSCSWIAHLQRQVVDRQSPEVDYVSGATQSTNAFYYAVVEALLKAKP